MDDNSGKLVTRRHVVAGAGLVGAAATAAGSASAARQAPPGATLDRSRAESLRRLARVITSFPVALPFPARDTGSQGPSRAVLARQLDRCPPRRRALAVRGAEILAQAGATGSKTPADFTIATGRAYAIGAREDRLALVAATAVAAAAISPHFDPRDDATARLWLDFARRLDGHATEKTDKKGARRAL